MTGNEVEVTKCILF